MQKAVTKTAATKPHQPFGVRARRTIHRDWQLWVLLIPALAFFIVFCYFPMYGVQIAFKDFKVGLGITASPWASTKGQLDLFKHFRNFFSMYYCGRMFADTLLLNLYGLLFSFPIPILLAIMLNQLNSKRFKGFTQTAIYVPHFISTVVLAGMLYLFFSPTNGIVNKVIEACGGKSIYFMVEENWFRPLFIGSDIWQNAGWNTILYIATLLASFPSHGEPHSPLSGAMTDILEMNIHQHTETGYDVIYITFKDGRQNCLVPSEQIFWHKGKDLFFRETFNDTIYQVETTGLTPVKRFDFGTMRWDRKDRYNPEKDQAFYPLDVCESDRILWLRFVVNLHHQEQWKVYNAIYDKINGDVKVAPFKEGIHDDLNGFLPLQPTFATPSGEFAQLVPAGKILEWFEKHTGQEDWPEEIKALKKLTEEDNPVVILME